MREASRRRGAVVKPWLIVTASLVIMGGLVWLLWNMNRPRPSGDRPKQLVLLCANGLLKPVEQIAARYKVEFGVEVIPRVNNSGGLLSDLRVAQNRADLFLAGEESFNREARAKGLVAEILPVAQQHVVLAVRPGNPEAHRRREGLARRGRPRGPAQSRADGGGPVGPAGAGRQRRLGSPVGTDEEVQRQGILGRHGDRRRPQT